MSAGAGAQYYLASGFFPTYLDVVVPVKASDGGWILLITSLFVIVAATAAGEASGSADGARCWQSAA